MEKLPARIDTYELLGKLARGGMGTVYLARRAGAAGFQRLFAVKVIHEHLADSEECVEMFLDEARLSSRLHHSNVVPVVDVGETAGRHYVVMDYIEGTSLGYLLKKSPDDRPAGAIAKLFADFLDGLHAAHELSGEDGETLNLVHRDVSPPNVLVGVDGVGRISDFGIAKAEERLTTTRTGLRKGKLAFMAPEQLLDEPIDRRTDIFAAGATLWTALTGEQLFQGGSDAATINNLLSRDIPKPSEGRLAPPPAFDEVCLRAMQRDPKDRYATAEEMANALRSAIDEASVEGLASGVSAWVKDAAGPTLARRKEMLAKALSERVTDQVSDESSLPSMGGETGQGLSGFGFGSPESKRTPLATTKDAERASNVEPRDRRPVLWALFVLIGAVVAFIVMREPESDGQQASQPPEPAPAPPQTSAPRAPETKDDVASEPRSETPSENQASKEEPDTAAPRAASPPTPAPLPRPVRVPATRPAPAPAPKGTKPPEQPPSKDSVYDDAKPEPKPSPAPDEPVIERNPYLRGK